MSTPAEHVLALEADLEDMAAANAGLLTEVADAAAMQQGLAAFARLAARRHAEIDRIIKRNQGANDEEWATWCGERRVWAEVVRLVEQIDGSA